MNIMLKTSTAAIAAIALAIGFSAAPLSLDLSKGGLSLASKVAFAKNGADDGPGDDRGGRGRGRDGGGDDGTPDQGRGDN